MSSPHPICPNVQVKQMAAVLLRRLLSSSFDEIYPGLPGDMQTAIKSELLVGIQAEGSPTIRKKVCDIAAELARNLVGRSTRTHPPPNSLLHVITFRICRLCFVRPVKFLVGR